MTLRTAAKSKCDKSRALVSPNMKSVIKPELKRQYNYRPKTKRE